MVFHWRYCCSFLGHYMIVLNDDNFLTMEAIQKSINNIDMRRDWIVKGKKDAESFLEKIKYKER